MATPQSDEAPGSLERLRLFINTAYQTRFDREELADPASATAWCRQHELIEAEDELDAKDVERLIGMRLALRDAALANNHRFDAVDAWRRIAGHAHNLPAQFSVQGPEDVCVLPAGNTPGERAAARLIRAVYDGVRSETWHRLKACPRQDCFYAFYDRSKNRSATWCDMMTCGNREKARRRRSRAATAAT